MKLAFLRRVALGGSSWRALCVAMPALTREEREGAMIRSGRDLGLLRSR